MKSSSWLGQALIAILLVAAGAILWRSSEYERRLAAAERDLVTLKYEDAATAAAQPGGRLAGLMPMSAAAQDAKALASTAAYWRGDYDKAIENPDAKLLAANAQFRKIREQGGSWQAVVGRMDSLVKLYAEILRESPNNAEAAFNYEYVAKTRDMIAKGTPRLKPEKDPTDQLAMDLPPGTTVHGRHGAPPVTMSMEDFKTISPMRFDEREDQAQPGRGAVQKRRG